MNQSSQNHITIKLSESATYRFIVRTQQEGYLTDIHLPSEAAFILARSVFINDGKNRWQKYRLVFAHVSSNFSDTMLNGQGADFFWDTLLIFHSESPLEIQNCYQDASDAIKWTNQNETLMEIYAKVT